MIIRDRMRNRKDMVKAPIAAWVNLWEWEPPKGSGCNRNAGVGLLCRRRRANWNAERKGGAETRKSSTQPIADGWNSQGKRQRGTTETTR